jgi:MoaA/NifB/PqqE/SkfB family radical SAM enzyme
MTNGEPKSLELFVNYACNAKCPFCFNPPDAGPELERGLPFEALARRIYAGRAEGFQAIKFIGGEATIREDLPKLIALSRKVGYSPIQLTTNGIRLADKRYARRLFQLGCGSFRFSVHGHTADLHDRLVGAPGALEKLRTAVGHLRLLGARLGINTVLSRENVSALPEMLEFFQDELGIEDVLVYFLRYQGFAALPQNRERLRLRFADAAPHVRRAFDRLSRAGRPLPWLIHFPPCALPELRDRLADWRRVPEEGRTVLPDGEGGPVVEVTNRGKAPVAACGTCSLAAECLGVEREYVKEFGEAEFRPVAATAAA